MSKTDDILASMNKQEIQIALILQTTMAQEQHLGKLNGTTEKNQAAIIENSKALAVAIAGIKSNKGNLALMWRILVPVIAGTIGAGIAAFVM